MEIADTIFLILLGLFVIRATIRGFIDEFFSKASVIGGGFAGVVFYRRLTPFIKTLNFSAAQALPSVISFLLIFLSSYLIIKFIQNIAGSIFQNGTLRALDMALGFFLGIAEWLIVMGIILAIMYQQPFFDANQLLGNSIIANTILEIILSEPNF